MLPVSKPTGLQSAASEKKHRCGWTVFYTYDVYGKPTATGALANEFDFAAQQTDGSTGLQYLRARYMDPETGTFVSREPMESSPGWTGGPYGYGSANPARMVDPTGARPCDVDDCPNGWRPPAPPPPPDFPNGDYPGANEPSVYAVCAGVDYYKYDQCRELIDFESFSQWKARVIIFGAFGKPLIGEYLHKRMRSCAESSECRPILELIASGEAGSGSAGVLDAWKADLRYGWLFAKGSWVIFAGTQIAGAYLTLYKPAD